MLSSTVLGSMVWGAANWNSGAVMTARMLMYCIFKMVYVWVRCCIDYQRLFQISSIKVESRRQADVSDVNVGAYRTFCLCFSPGAWKVATKELQKMCACKRMYEMTKRCYRTIDEVEGTTDGKEFMSEERKSMAAAESISRTDKQGSWVLRYAVSCTPRSHSGDHTSIIGLFLLEV